MVMQVYVLLKSKKGLCVCSGETKEKGCIRMKCVLSVFCFSLIFFTFNFFKSCL